MHICSDQRVMTNEAVFIILAAVHRHTRLSRLHSASGTTLTDGYLDATHIGTVQSVMGQHMQVFLICVQCEDARLLRTTEMYRLRGNDLQHFVQVERRGDDRGDAVDGS